MLVLLPPSETKRDGGDRPPLDLAALHHPELAEIRSGLVDRVVALADDVAAALHALKLGPRQVAEVERNRRLRTSGTMPAIDRYTGVLFDALDAARLDTASRAFAGQAVMVHSALFGLVGALDPIPAYRLSHDSRVPGVRLRSLWQAPLEACLAERRGLIVDLRSEGYASLGRAPTRAGSAFVRVVSEDGDGRRRTLNHFNKQAKGAFTRAMVVDRPSLHTVDDLIAWAGEAGFSLDLGSSRRADGPIELELVA
ncbi:YaaA family protein [Agromyces sp. Marseille-P2726]|uniref:YaaA family protein n=1 Tax=Agromyces sp. Marseille-P2726 TaxID=2709132 RepID=UPI00156DE6E7|nr:peroxide stress protein YaaA [Agromyces sp. Marseille-P2726]